MNHNTQAGSADGKEQPTKPAPVSTKSLILLFTGITIIGFFTSHGTLSVDPPNRYIVAKSIVDYGDLQMRLAPGEPIPPGTNIGVDGKYHSQFGLGQSLIFAGPYYVCRHLLGIESDKLIRSIISLTVFPVTLGLTGLVFFLLLREFDIPLRRSYLAAILLIFATGIWQVSKEGQEASHLTFLVTLIAYCLRRYQKHGSLQTLAISAFAVGFGFLIRSDFAPTVWCYLIFVFYLIRQNLSKRAKISVTKISIIQKNIPYILIIFICGVFFLIHSYTTYRHFGDLWSPPHNPFGLQYLATGLKGLLFSPGRGLFLYNPVFLLVVPGLICLCRRQLAWALFVLGAFIGCLLLHSAVDCFHGNCCWGPRYLIRQFPLLFLAVVFYGFRLEVLSRSRVMIVSVIVGLSLLVQIASVSLHHNRELEELAYAYKVGWSERRWTMFEPEANFIKHRVVNIYHSIDDMIHDKIGAWPEPTDQVATAQERLQAPVLHYPAFWPYHITYYLPTVKPTLAAPVWVSSLIFLGGVLLGVLLLIKGAPGKNKSG